MISCMTINWYTVITAGLIDSFNPCAITVLLLFIALLFSLQKTRVQTLAIIASYIIALYITYLLIGIGLLRVVYLFDNTNVIAKISAVILILIALYGIAENTIKGIPHQLTIKPKQRQIINGWMNKGSIPAAIVSGLLVGLFEFPCSGAIYVTIISYLAKENTYMQGLLYLIVYNIAFVAPLIILVFITHNRLIAEKIIYWQEKNGKSSRIILHTLLLILGILLLFWVI